MKPFPRTTVAGVSLPRMLMGTNWVYGYSHTGAAADKNIVRMNSNKEAIQAMLEAYLAYDINAIMGPISDKPFTYDAIHAAEDKTGKGIIQIDTPTLVMDDNAQARKESEAILDKSRKGGATFCLIHHSAAEQLVNKNKRTMDRLPDYLKMIRDRGMIPGLSAHMPELILYSDLNGYDVETYIQIYNQQDHLGGQEARDDHQVHGGRPLLAVCGHHLLLQHPAPLRHGHRRRHDRRRGPRGRGDRHGRHRAPPPGPGGPQQPQQDRHHQVTRANRETPGSRARSGSVRGSPFFYPRLRRYVRAFSGSVASSGGAPAACAGLPHRQPWMRSIRKDESVTVMTEKKIFFTGM